MSKITVTWHGHSCFTVAADGYSVVLDPFAPGSVPGYADICETANAVFCSHGHGDHNYAEAVTIADNGAKNPFTVTEIDTYHDDQKGALRGTNVIRIFEADGIRIAHLGDLGCMPEPEQMEQLKNLDAILIPVGGHFTIDAKQAKELVDAVKPRVVVPMHYRTADFGYPVIGLLENYTSLCDDIVVHDSASLEIGKETAAQTAILQVG